MGGEGGGGTRTLEQVIFFAKNPKLIFFTKNPHRKLKKNWVGGGGGGVGVSEFFSKIPNLKNKNVLFCVG